jgi:hypothetical protein
LLHGPRRYSIQLPTTLCSASRMQALHFFHGAAIDRAIFRD